MADPSQSYGSYSAGNNGYSYGSSMPRYGEGGGNEGLRRRGGPTDSSTPKYNHYTDTSKTRKMVRNLDILFPKVDQEFTVSGGNGGMTSTCMIFFLLLLGISEILFWMSQNAAIETSTKVDTSLNQPMRINLNVTFPALACENLHVDIIDVAGDSQLDIEDTLRKKPLHLDGTSVSQAEMLVEANLHQQRQAEKQKLLNENLPENYCGPCYGAQDEEGQCCQTCDDILAAYEKKGWKTELLKFTSEQCIREGRDHVEPKPMVKGQGCNLSGYMTVNRVSGNFHIAMGEGVERDGRHIHTYLPEDAPNFNSSHIIHQLSFGPEDGTEPLNGATKIVTEGTGTTGLFQYFIKIVPTSYISDAIPTSMKKGEALPSLFAEGENQSKDRVETNRYFFTERFLPLMTELLEDHHHMGDEHYNKAAVHAGHGGDHSNHEHHKKQNAVLPGVFFIYEIYPFAVEIRKTSVPLTHLLIRLLATAGGVLTVARWADTWLYQRKHRR